MDLEASGLPADSAALQECSRAPDGESIPSVDADTHAATNRARTRGAMKVTDHVRTTVATESMDATRMGTTGAESSEDDSEVGLS